MEEYSQVSQAKDEDHDSTSQTCALFDVLDHEHEMSRERRISFSRRVRVEAKQGSLILDP